MVGVILCLGLCWARVAGEQMFWGFALGNFLLAGLGFCYRMALCMVCLCVGFWFGHELCAWLGRFSVWGFVGPKLR